MIPLLVLLGSWLLPGVDEEGRLEVEFELDLLLPLGLIKGKGVGISPATDGGKEVKSHWARYMDIERPSWSGCWVWDFVLVGRER